MNKFAAHRSVQEDNRTDSRFVEMSLDELDPGEAITRTRYFSINYSDAILHHGTGRMTGCYVVRVRQVG